MALPALLLLMLVLHPCDTGMTWLWLGWFLLLYLCAGLDWQPVIINTLTMKLVLLLLAPADWVHVLGSAGAAPA
jgi:cell division protein FtsW (lipid II flippase)